MKILLVDDSRAVALATMARLASFGYEVRHAVDGATAIELFQREAFDLVLMDIEMPGMNGFETTARIRALEGDAAWAWTPIIFVTATDTPDNLVTAIEAGGDDFISKTVPEAVLQAKMKAMSRIATLRARLAAANARLQDQASRDGLTGLMNRRAMDAQVDRLWETAVRDGKPFGLLMIDIDHFKKYNDHYGHPAGDDCLRAVAARLDAGVRRLNDERSAPAAFVARYGGEEFAVIVPDVSPADLTGLAAGVVEAVAELAMPHALNSEHGIVTISVGAACATPASGPVKQLFRQADALLYRAKQNGRNRAETG